MDSLVRWLRADESHLKQFAEAGALEFELYEVMRQHLFRADLDEATAAEEEVPASKFTHSDSPEHAHAKVGD